MRSSLNVHRQTIYSIRLSHRAHEMLNAEQNNGIGKYFSSQQLFSWLINRVCARTLIYSQPIKAQASVNIIFECHTVQIE